MIGNADQCIQIATRKRYRPSSNYDNSIRVTECAACGRHCRKHNVQAMGNVIDYAKKIIY